MNVTSVAFVSKYLETGMPLTTKRLTVDGDIVKEPKNVEVLIGTPIQELLDFCGGLTAQPGKVLYGGPMMGTCVADLSQPILKNNNAVLAFSEKLARLPKKDQLHPLRPVRQRLPPGPGGQGHREGVRKRQRGAAPGAERRPVHELRYLLLCLPRQAASGPLHRPGEDHDEEWR